MVREFEMTGPLSSGAPSYSQTGRLQGVLRSMLDQSNGASAYGGAFVLLPSGTSDAVSTMEEVNDGTWKAAYSQDVRDTWFFAVDVMGRPFGIRDDEIVHLILETGELRPVGSKFGEFLDALKADPDTMVDLDYLEEWFEIGQTMDIRERLVAKVPVIVGGGKGASAYGVGALMDVLGYHADLYGQLKDVPNGSKVRFVARS